MKGKWKKPKVDLKPLQDLVLALNQQADALDRRAEEIEAMGRMVAPTPPESPLSKGDRDEK